MKALLEHEPDNASYQRDAVGDLRPHRRHACAPSATSMRRSRATAAASRSSRRLAAARPGQRGLAARSVRQPRPHRRGARQAGRSRGGARELPARGWRSRRRSPCASPTTCSGSGTSPPATTASATSMIAQGRIEEALVSYRRGTGDRRGAGQARSRPSRLAARPGGQLPQDRLPAGARAPRRGARGAREGSRHHRPAGGDRRAPGAVALRPLQVRRRAAHAQGLDGLRAPQAQVGRIGR